jgi:transposase
MPGFMQGFPREELSRREVMQTPDDVAAMLRLKALGWGIRRIAGELGCSHMTVRRYVSAGGWVGYQGRGRPKTLTGYEDWLSERFRRHAGNADVVRQELEAEEGIKVSLRTLERAVAHLRRELAAEARATVRFETPPGRQMQIDFGERQVVIGESSEKVFLFVATLGFSRRIHVRAYHHERQENWFDGLESAFRAFGGVTEEILFDNARPLVDRHVSATREIVFNAKLHAFAKHWRFRPRACAPYRARTKGKDERGVSYVKKNAIAGRQFMSWSALEAHLEKWARDVADARIHGTTEEIPMERFQREEAKALRSIDGLPPFQTTRELIRRVHTDCSVEFESNAYSVPWRLIGESVRVAVTGGIIRICHGGREVAVHEERAGRRQRAVDPMHFEGVVGFRAKVAREDKSSDSEPGPSLLRPLAEYDAAAGGGW